MQSSARNLRWPHMQSRQLSSEPATYNGGWHETGSTWLTCFDWSAFSKMSSFFKDDFVFKDLQKWFEFILQTVSYETTFCWTLRSITANRIQINFIETLKTKKTMKMMTLKTLQASNALQSAASHFSSFSFSLYFVAAFSILFQTDHSIFEIEPLIFDLLMAWYSAMRFGSLSVSLAVYLSPEITFKSTINSDIL